MAPKAPLDTSSSTVDSVFDDLTARAARGLLAVESALHRVARWIDTQATVAGKLAIKLSSPADTAPAGTANAGN